MNEADLYNLYNSHRGPSGIPVKVYWIVKKLKKTYEMIDGPFTSREDANITLECHTRRSALVIMSSVIYCQIEEEK